MTDPTDQRHLLANDAARRLWLLAEALHSLPFDRAVDLARAAEAFVMGCESIMDTASQPGLGQPNEQLIAPQAASDEPKPRRIALADNERERLLDRIAQGARNAELALEFGLSAKQVQGLRMGCAQEIAERREKRGQPLPASAHPDDDAVPSSSIDEIVRYLRQQDDVVVSQEDGGFLVNGRFRMSAAELTLRANRMRRRQQKPAFHASNKAVQDYSNGTSKGHPVFWEDAAASDNRFNCSARIDTEGA
jgi:hypothetical protein